MTEKRRFFPACLSGNALKFIAIFTMLIDHIGAALIENGILCAYDIDRMMVILETEEGMRWYLFDLALRLIGRIAFPIFCFLLVEGFLHTRDERKYARNLLLFAFLSEVPFDTAFSCVPVYWGAQNVYFTLFIGVVMMCFLRKYEGRQEMQAVVVAAACVAAFLLKCDYSYFGVLIIAVMYLLRYQRSRRFITTGVLAALESLPLFGAAALSLIPIACYNGKRGKLRIKYFFYLFYPVHIVLLAGLRCLLF